MNRLMTLAAAGAVAVASSSGVAFAQSVEKDAKITITANEPEICGFVPGTARAEGFFGSQDGTTNTASIDDIKLIDTAEKFANAPSGFQFKVFIGAKCNTVAEVKARCINGGALVNEAAEDRGSTLVTRLPYGVRFQFENPGTVQNFNGEMCPTELTFLFEKADFDKELIINFIPDVSDSGTRAAGDFTDTVEIELGPRS